MFYLLQSKPLPDIFILYPITIMSFVVIYFLFMILNSKKKFPEEEGKSPICDITCSGWIGMLHYTYPFVNIRLYDDFMIIGYRRRKLIYYSEINEITYKQYYRVIAKGIAINHNRGDVPERVIIFPIHNKIILETLKTKVKYVE